MIWARFCRALTLGETPELSVFSSKHFTGLSVTPRWSRLGWLTLPPAPVSWCEAGDKSAGSWPKSPDVQLREHLCFFFFLNTKINEHCSQFSCAGDTCRACAISDKHTWRWCGFYSLGLKYLFMKKKKYQDPLIYFKWLSIRQLPYAVDSPFFPQSFKEKKTDRGKD